MRLYVDIDRRLLMIGSANPGNPRPVQLWVDSFVDFTVFLYSEDAERQGDFFPADPPEAITSVVIEIVDDQNEKLLHASEALTPGVLPAPTVAIQQEQAGGGGNNEVQSVLFSNYPDGGHFGLVYSDFSRTPSFDPAAWSADEIQAGLESTGIGEGNVIVSSRGAEIGFDIEFTGTLADTAVVLLGLSSFLRPRKGFTVGHTLVETGLSQYILDNGANGVLSCELGMVATTVSGETDLFRGKAEIHAAGSDIPAPT